MEIDQEKLCEYCIDNHDMNPNNCEGSMCDQARNNYMEDFGISEAKPSHKCFQNLHIGSTIYVINKDRANLCIDEGAVNSVNLNEYGIKVQYNAPSLGKGTYTVEIPTASLICVSYTKHSPSVVYYLHKADAVKALEKVCMDRILSITKTLAQYQA